MSRLQVNGTEIAFDIAGTGPPVLLLHGFPQTRAMWGAIAPRLARRFTVVTADLRGYGDSAAPQGPAACSFRAMGADQLALMRELGFPRFHLVGHDRGARTAHRMALDAPEAVASLALLDIVPTLVLLDRLSPQVARAYYHWFFLAQPAPFPETIIGHDPDAFFESCLAGWGGAGLSGFDDARLAAYRAAWRRPDTIRAMCADYRDTLDHDLALDKGDRHRKLSCPALVLWGEDGVMARAFDMAASWADSLSDMRARALPGGHFFPDEHPETTAAALLDFLEDLPL